MSVCSCGERTGGSRFIYIFGRVLDCADEASSLNKPIDDLYSFLAWFEVVDVLFLVPFFFDMVFWST